MIDHTIIKDNFLEDPLPARLRDLAFGMSFASSKEGIYSGRRTQDLKYSHKFLYDNICKKILNLYNVNMNDYGAIMHFHITEGKFGSSGWVHSDSPCALASIIYLNPQVNNIECGTGLYSVDTSAQNTSDASMLKKSFIEGKDYVREKNEYNSRFIKTVTIGGVFNRMVSYPGSVYHAGEGYFGNDVSDSRLTLLAFFFKK